MKSMTAIAFFTLVNLFFTSAQEIYQPGPFTVQHTIYLSLFNVGLDHNVDVWAPDGSGEFPVVFFIPGFTGTPN